MRQVRESRYPMHEKCPYSEFFWSVFSGIRTVQMRENMDQKNSEYGHFSRSDLEIVPLLSITNI